MMQQRKQHTGGLTFNPNCWTGPFFGPLVFYITSSVLKKKKVGVGQHVSSTRLVTVIFVFSILFTYYSVLAVAGVGSLLLRTVLCFLLST
jgi:hypothetical protein